MESSLSRGGDRNDARETKPIPCEVDGCLRGLERITVAAIGGQEREAQVDVRQRVALDETAHADRRAVVGALGEPKAEAALRVHLGEPGFDVAPRVALRRASDAAIPDANVR